MEKQFIESVLDIDVDGFTGTVRYIVTEMYNILHEDGFASIDFKKVEDVTMTRVEIEKEGGHQEVVKQLKECYGIA